MGGGGGFCSHQSGSQGFQLLSADLFGALSINCVISSQYLLIPIKTSSARGQGPNYRIVPTSLIHQQLPLVRLLRLRLGVFHNNNINYQHHSYSRYYNSYNHSKVSTQQGFQHRSGYQRSKCKSDPPPSPPQAKKDGK